MKKYINCWFFRTFTMLIVNGLVCWPTNLAADSGAAPPTAKTIAPNQGIVKANRVNIRSRPSTAAEVLGQLNRGDVVDIHSRTNVTEAGQSRDWLQISLPASARAFVASRFVSDGRITADDVMVRCGPGTNYRDIGRVQKNESVTVVGQQGDWTQIRPTLTCRGWVAADLVDVPPPAVAASEPPVATEIVLPPAPQPLPPAPPVVDVQIIPTDPDVRTQQVVKVGILGATAEGPTGYELLTEERMRLQHRRSYVEAPEVNLERYVGKWVRIVGTEIWRRGDRYPVIKADQIDIVW
ncbi:MAG: SH3 domain-containing protein [Verrucomicrobiae bacterium]|nr:SH3 domain-containing protein [Verrucomicrobiae bacterium]MDW8343114.1 SH3 domain-containing protein [Verrucomicrobiae bacterium]